MVNFDNVYEGLSTQEAALPDFNQLATYSHRESYTTEYMGQKIIMNSSDWRDSTLLKFQLAGGFINFIVFGLAEQTIGTAIPHIEKEYQITDFHVGMIFLASTSGYFVMAVMSDILHRALGVRGLGILGSLCMTVSYFVIYQRPPFILFAGCYFLSGLGFGTLDATFNGWMANLVNSNQILGMLHGFYGVGCMILPPVLTRLMERKVDPWRWNDYYLFLSCLAAFNVVFFGHIYRHETPAKFRFMLGLQEARKRLLVREAADGELDDTAELLSEEYSKKTEDLDMGLEAASLSESLRTKEIWLFAISMFIYVGAEVAFGTWLITFLTRIKHMKSQLASYMATTFWTGLTVGRMFLGLVTAKYFSHELTANSAYVFLSFSLHVLLCMIIFTPLIAVQFIIVFLAGIFVGPIFPHIISTSVKVLPVRFQTTGVGFICAFGGGGAAGVPFLVGLVAQSSKAGLRFYVFLVTILYAILLLLWLYVARLYRHVTVALVHQPQ